MVKLRAAGFAGKLNGQNMTGDGVGGGGLPRGGGYKPSDIRFTTHGDTLYATVMAWPTDPVVITSLATGKAPQGKIQKVELLGHSGDLAFTQDADGLKVTFPTDKPCDYAYVLKITGLKLN
jgi:alpha-L-fucosidase